jgi:hypothetical protein
MMLEPKNHIRIFKALRVLIFDVRQSFNIGNNMTDEQVDDAIPRIMQQYKIYKIADFKLCFDRARQHRYGKSYNRVDEAVLNEWLSAYDIERDEEIIALRTKENSQFKHLAKEGPSFQNDIHKNYVEKSLKRLKEEQAAEKELKKTLAEENKIKLDDETKKRNEMFQAWHKEFDEIYYHQIKIGEIKDSTPRCIKLGEHRIDINEFLLLKLDELNEAA